MEFAHGVDEFYFVVGGEFVGVEAEEVLSEDVDFVGDIDQKVVLFAFVVECLD